MDEAANALHNLGTQEVRLVRENIPKQRLEEPKLWVYQYRNGADKEWNSFYSFSELEFFQEDFEVQNWWTSVKTLHRWTVLVVRFLREGEPIKFPQNDDWRNCDDNIMRVAGKVMLVNDVVKINVGNKTQVLHRFDSEDGRIRALQEYFGIVLSQEEVSSIRGWDMELK